MSFPLEQIIMLLPLRELLVQNLQFPLGNKSFKRADFGNIFIQKLRFRWLVIGKRVNQINYIRNFILVITKVGFSFHSVVDELKNVVKRSCLLLSLNNSNVLFLIFVSEKYLPLVSIHTDTPITRSSVSGNLPSEPHFFLGSSGDKMIVGVL